MDACRLDVLGLNVKMGGWRLSGAVWSRVSTRALYCRISLDAWRDRSAIA